MKRNKNKFYKLICLNDLDDVSNKVVPFRIYCKRKEANEDESINEKAVRNNINRKWEYFNVNNKCKDIVKDKKIFELYEKVLSEKVIGKRFYKENIKYKKKNIEYLLSLYKEDEENILFEDKCFINKDELRIYLYFIKIKKCKKDLELLNGYELFGSLDDDYKINVNNEFVILSLFNYLNRESMLNKFMNDKEFMDLVFNKLVEKLNEINLKLDEEFIVEEEDY